MKLFLLEDVQTDPRYCFVASELPCGAELSDGEPAAPDIERLELDVLELQMDEDQGGLERPDYVSNTDNMLLLRSSFADAIVDGFEVGPHELWPARLINEKQRIHAEDYTVLNPLGRFDCLDRALSEIDESTEEPMVNPWGKWLLRGSLVPADRDLFRVAGVLGYVFSERLVSFIRAGGMTNLAFVPIPIT